MPFEKGESGNPAGRPKGSKNRSTKAMKEALSQLVDDNLENMSDWLNEMARDDPKAAFQCMLNLMEFQMPKMSRVTWIDENEASERNSAGGEDILRRVTEAYDQAMQEAEKKDFTSLRKKHEYIEKRIDELDENI